MSRLLTEAAPPGGRQTHPLLQPKWLAAAAVVFVAVVVLARFAYQKATGGPDVALQEAEVKVICDELSQELRNKPAQDVLSRLGAPDRRGTEKGYEYWVYTATEGGQFAVRFYAGKVSRVGPDVPAGQ